MRYLGNKESILTEISNLLESQGLLKEGDHIGLKQQNEMELSFHTGQNDNQQKICKQ